VDYFPLHGESPRRSLAELKNPDRMASSSATFIEERDGNIYWVMQVKGLGVIVLRGGTSWLLKDGKIEFKGMSTFTKSEIGYSEHV
jgi:hypothetical protein